MIYLLHYTAPNGMGQPLSHWTEERWFDNLDSLRDYCEGRDYLHTVTTKPEQIDWRKPKTQPPVLLSDGDKCPKCGSEQILKVLPGRADHLQNNFCEDCGLHWESMKEGF